MSKKIIKAVRVVWTDPAFASNGWQHIPDFERWIANGLKPVESVGFVSYECADFIVLSQTIGLSQIADSVKIARTAIQLITELGETEIETNLRMSTSQK